MSEAIATEPVAPESIIAEFNDYRSLVAALRRAREKRNVSFTTMDEIVTAPDGYFSKVMAPRGSRRLTPLSLGWALGVLGLKCLLVDDERALARLNASGKMVERNSCMVRDGAVHILLSRKFFSEIGRKGAAKRNALRMRRKAAARKAANARWHNGSGRR